MLQTCARKHGVIYNSLIHVDAIRAALPHDICDACCENWRINVIPGPRSQRHVTTLHTEWRVQSQRKIFRGSCVPVQTEFRWSEINQDSRLCVRVCVCVIQTRTRTLAHNKRAFGIEIRGTSRTVSNCECGGFGGALKGERTHSHRRVHIYRITSLCGWDTGAQLGCQGQCIIWDSHLSVGRPDVSVLTVLCEHWSSEGPGP